MFVDRQNLLEILQYICFAGLILSVAAVFIFGDLKKKVISLFFIFVFITILSFIFFVGILLFITGFIFIFVFIVLYLLASETMRTTRSYIFKKRRRKFVLKAGGTTAALLFCSWLGYIIYNIFAGYFPDINPQKDPYILGFGEISVSLFTTYNIVIIIIIAAACITFIGITTLYCKRRKDRGCKQ